MKKYFIDTDGYDNWYVVPSNRREEFEAWCQLDRIHWMGGLYLNMYI